MGFKYIRINFIVLLTCLVGPNSFSKELIFYEHGDDFSFSIVEAISLPSQIEYSEEFIDSDEWQEHPLYFFDGLIREKTGSHFVKTDVSYGLIVRAAVLLENTNSSLSAQSYLDPKNHVAANKTVKLEFIGRHNDREMKFRTLLKTSIFNLQGTLSDQFVLDSDIEFDQYRSHLPVLKQIQARQIQPKALSIRIGSNYNRILNSAFAITEFYEPEDNSHQIFVVGHLFFSINESALTTGIGGFIAKFKISQIMKRSLLENLEAATAFTRP